MDVPEVLNFEKKQKLFVYVSWTTSPNPMLHEFLKFGVFHVEILSYTHL
jgi:hypothetical protein